MPLTFNLFRLRRLSDVPSVTNSVLFREGDDELQGTPAQTLVTYNNTDATAVECYTSQHEILKKVEGRLYDGREFHEYYKKNHVRFYARRATNLIACQSSGAVARNLMDKLNKAFPSRFRVDYLAIDFELIRSKIESLNGIWLSQINQPNIETLAMFGSQVDKSQLYLALKSLGHAAAILIAQDVGGRNVPVILSSRGSLTFPQPAATSELLEIAFILHDELLKPGLIERDSPKTAAEKRAAARAQAA